MEKQYTPEELSKATEHVRQALNEIKAALGILGRLDTDGLVPINFNDELAVLWWNLWGEESKLYNLKNAETLATS